jgi:hypothetical protein
MLPRTIEELEELQSVDNSLPGMSGALPIMNDSISTIDFKISSAYASNLRGINIFLGFKNILPDHLILQRSRSQQVNIVVMKELL